MSEKSSASKKATRRKFLLAAGATGAATIAMPQVSSAQTTTMKLQTRGPPTTSSPNMPAVLHQKVNDMAGGRLKIDVLHGGAVVRPSRCSSGVEAARSTWPTR